MQHTRNHKRAARFPILPCTGMGLSSLHCYHWSGELLPPLFTLTPRKREAVIFCDTVRHDGFPRRAPVFTRNPALRCPDFPLAHKGRANAHTSKPTQTLCQAFPKNTSFDFILLESHFKVPLHPALSPCLIEKINRRENVPPEPITLSDQKALITQGIKGLNGFATNTTKEPACGHETLKSQTHHCRGHPH